MFSWAFGCCQAPNAQIGQRGTLQSLAVQGLVEHNSKSRTAKKLRERAAKALKSLVRVNLCAGQSHRPVGPNLCRLDESGAQPILWTSPLSWETNQARLRSKFDDQFNVEGVLTCLESWTPSLLDHCDFAVEGEQSSS
jgi:hypothetical protein